MLSCCATFRKLLECWSSREILNKSFSKCPVYSDNYLGGFASHRYLNPFFFFNPSHNESTYGCHLKLGRLWCHITASDPKIFESKEEKYVNLEKFEKKRRELEEHMQRITVIWIRVRPWMHIYIISIFQKLQNPLVLMIFSKQCTIKIT